MPNEIQKIEQTGSAIMSTEQVVDQVRLVQDVMRTVMRDGEHYGVVPGCGTKPTLLKPGAEKIGFTFRLAPAFVVSARDLKDDHREYEVICTLTHIQSGLVWGQGVGCCSSMEAKYRYRWEGRGENKRRVPNKDIADTYNTVLKMAKKRAHVDAILTATAASDIFTQDIEDFGSKTSAKKSSGRKPAGGKKASGGRGASEKQVKFLHRLADGCGATREEMVAIMQHYWKKESSKDLTGKEASSLIDLLKVDDGFDAIGREAFEESVLVNIKPPKDKGLEEEAASLFQGEVVDEEG